MLKIKTQNLVRSKFLVLAGIAVCGKMLAADTISYPDFSSTAGLSINEDAAAATDDMGRAVLRVTPAVDGSAGSAFSTTEISLASDASFSTFFSFRFTSPGDDGADGLVFAVQNVSSTAGAAGGGIGYAGLADSVGVEFDTFDNGGGLGDADGNHVAINTEGSLSSPLAYANVDSLGQMDQTSGPDLMWYSWIDYDGASDLLEVRLATGPGDGSSEPARPGLALISATVDIPTILGDTDAFVGFTSGTGIAHNHHDVLSWGFRGFLDPFEDTDPTTPPPTGVPEGGAQWAGWLALLGLIAWHSRMRPHLTA